MSAPHNSSRSEDPPNAPLNEQPNWSSGTGGSPFPDQNLAPHEDDPSAASQPDDPMPTETSSDSDILSLINSLARSVLYVDDTGDWLSAFVGRICLRLHENHSADKRDVLVSADTAANVELAAFVFGMEGDVYGDMREPLMAKFRQFVQSMLHAFRQWWYCWATTPVHQLLSEEAAQSLSEEATSHSPVGWMRALVSVFGHVPELWDLPSSIKSSDLGCPGPLGATSRGKGKGIDRSNMLLSDLQAEWATKHSAQHPTTPMNTIQAAPTPDSGEAGAAESQPQPSVAPEYEAPRPISIAHELQFVFYDGPPSSPASRRILQPVQDAPPSSTTGGAPQSASAPGNAPQPTTGGAPQSAPGDTPQPTPGEAPQSTPGGQFSTAAQGEETSTQSPSAAPLPYGPGTSSSGAVEFGAFDFTALASALGTTELRLPDATSTRAFEEATAHLRWAWGGSSHSLPLASGSSRGNRTADWRQQAHRLAQEYKEVKEAQIAKLAEAVQYLRSWHSLYLEVEYRLESRGIAVSPEFRAQAARMFLFTNLLTLLVIHRRRQLERLG